MALYSVPDMSCGHCKSSVEAALKAIGAKAEVDLPNRVVEVSGAAPETVIAALDAVGFAAQLQP